MRYEKYFSYFKSLAKSHKTLQHKDSPGLMTFNRATIEEAMFGISSLVKEKGFSFILIDYTWYTTEAENQDPQKNVQGAFIVSKHCRRDDHEGYVRAMSETEQIAEDFIDRMIYDSRKGHEMFYHSLNHRENFNAQPTEGVGISYAGWLVSFQISPSLPQSLSCDSSKWTDL